MPRGPHLGADILLFLWWAYRQTPSVGGNQTEQCRPGLLHCCSRGVNAARYDV